LKQIGFSIEVLLLLKKIGFRIGNGRLGRIQSRLVIGWVNFKQKIAGFYLLIVPDRNADNRARDTRRNTNDVRSDLAIAGPGIRDILLVQKPGGTGRDDGNNKRDQIPVNRDFHGAKKRPIRLPNRTAKAAKNRGRCQTWRVKPRRSSKSVTAHADKKPRTIIAIDQGVLKS